MAQDRMVWRQMLGDPGHRAIDITKKFDKRTAYVAAARAWLKVNK